MDNVKPPDDFIDRQVIVSVSTSNSMSFAFPSPRALEFNNSIDSNNNNTENRWSASCSFVRKIATVSQERKDLFTMLKFTSSNASIVECTDNKFSEPVQSFLAENFKSEGMCGIKRATVEVTKQVRRARCKSHLAYFIIDWETLAESSETDFAHLSDLLQCRFIIFGDVADFYDIREKFHSICEATQSSRHKSIIKTISTWKDVESLTKLISAERFPLEEDEEGVKFSAQLFLGQLTASVEVMGVKSEIPVFEQITILGTQCEQTSNEIYATLGHLENIAYIQMSKVKNPIKNVKLTETNELTTLSAALYEEKLSALCECRASSSRRFGLIYGIYEKDEEGEDCRRLVLVLFDEREKKKWLKFLKYEVNDDNPHHRRVNKTICRPTLMVTANSISSAVASLERAVVRGDRETFRLKVERMIYEYKVIGYNSAFLIPFLEKWLQHDHFREVITGILKSLKRI